MCRAVDPHKYILGPLCYYSKVGISKVSYPASQPSHSKRRSSRSRPPHTSQLVWSKSTSTCSSCPGLTGFWTAIYSHTYTLFSNFSTLHFKNATDVNTFYVTHCFLDLSTMTLSQENVIEDFPVHGTWVGILKNMKELKKMCCNCMYENQRTVISGNLLKSKPFRYNA